MYKVYVNLSLHRVCKTYEEVWKVLGEIPFGALYEVKDRQGNPVDEFIPF